ncbi:MAG: hypothetical protein DIU80_012340 [Chloroflexota bacterium]
MNWQVNLSGDFINDGDYYQFGLHPLDFRKLASLVVEVANGRSPLRVNIGSGVMNILLAKERVFMARKIQGGVELLADSENLITLSNNLMNMANDNDPSHFGLVHVHLDLYFTHEEGVSDIVIERIDDLDD